MEFLDNTSRIRDLKFLTETGKIISLRRIDDFYILIRRDETSVDVLQMNPSVEDNTLVLKLNNEHDWTFKIYKEEDHYTLKHNLFGLISSAKLFLVEDV